VRRATFIAGHIAATRLPAILRGIYPEFEGVAYTFQFAPYFFYWYYPVLAIAGVFLFVPGLASLLDQALPSVAGWAVALASAPAMLAVDALYKARRRDAHRRSSGGRARDA